MKNKTDEQKAIEYFDMFIEELRYFAECPLQEHFGNCPDIDLVIIDISKALINHEKLNTSEKHVNEAPNIEQAWDIAFLEKACYSSKKIRDVEALKKTIKDVDVRISCPLSWLGGWNDCIDHLHKNGHLGSIPDDMVLVPREPTKEMIFAAKNIHAETFDTGTDCDIYKAMIQASEVK